MLTKGAIGNLINRYRAVLDKCRLLNVFGSLAVAGMLVMGGAGIAVGAEISTWEKIEKDGTIKNGDIFSVQNSIGAMGGALYNLGTSASNINVTINNSRFIENTAPTHSIGNSYGGAIHSNYTNLTLKNSHFEDNSTQKSNGYGGAISFGNNSSATIDSSYFYKNNQYGISSTSSGGSFGGGAIYGDQGTTINIIGGEFRENYAEAKGGAIKADKNLTISGNTKFINNTANLDGGAIELSNTSTTTVINGAEFTGNSAGREGGAIFYRPTAATTPTLTFTGNNVFSSNKANTANGAEGTPNDIYSTADLIVASGTTELGSGYVQAEGHDPWTPTSITIPTLTVGTDDSANSAQLAVNGVGMDLQAGSVSVTKGGALGHGTDIAGLQAALAEAETNGVNTKDGAYVAKKPLDLSKAALTVGNATGAAAGQPVFGSGSTLLMDPAELGDSAAFYGVDTATVDGSTVYVQNAETGQTLKVFAKDEAGTTPASIVGKATVRASSSMIDGTLNPDGTLTTGTADVNAALPGVTPSLGALMTGMFDDNLQGVTNNEPGAMFLSRLVEDGYLRDNKSAAVRTLESAARMGLAVAPQMTWAANNAGVGAVAQRTTLARPQGSGMRAVDANGTPQTGISSGDGLKSGFGMWVMPLYQYWSANGLSGGGLDLDVKGNLGGVALGADYTINDSIRAGLTFNIGGGEAEGSGDFNDTDNNFSFWGIGAYAGWTYNNFGLTVDLNYTQTDNDVEQDMPAAMQMGKLESDIDSRAVSVGLRGEYKIATDALDIIPHAGVRYTWLKTDSYDVSSAAGTVMKGDAVDQDIWTFPVGVAFAKEFVTESGWNVRPSLDLSVIPAAGDLKARGDVRFTGVNGAASVKTEVLDKVTGMGQIGLDFGKDDVSMGLNYSLQTGENTTAHGLFATFRYEF